MIINDSLQTTIKKQLVDAGPVYTETTLDHLNNLIVEPWNAISSLFFLLPVIYWGIKLRGAYKEYAFLTFCLPLLFVGGLGSTFFHAFRSSPLLLAMDVLPIVILTLSVGLYLWDKALPKRYHVVFILLAYSVLYTLIWQFVPSAYRTNVSYFLRGTLMFVPMLLVLRRTSYEGWNLLVYTILFFALALTCRQLDHLASYVFPMGIHWLWHLFTVVGSFYLAEYLYRFANYEKKQKLKLAPIAVTTR